MNLELFSLASTSDLHERLAVRKRLSPDVFQVRVHNQLDPVRDVVPGALGASVNHRLSAEKVVSIGAPGSIGSDAAKYLEDLSLIKKTLVGPRRNRAGLGVFPAGGHKAPSVLHPVFRLSRKCGRANQREQQNGWRQFHTLSVTRDRLATQIAGSANHG